MLVLCIQHSHGNRTTLFGRLRRLKRRPTVRKGIECAPKRLACKRVSKALKTKETRATYPNVHLFIERVARFDVKQLGRPVRHRAVLGSQVLLVQCLRPVLDPYPGFERTSKVHQDWRHPVVRDHHVSASESAHRYIGGGV